MPLGLRLWICLLCCAASLRAAERPQGVLQLTSGDTIPGLLLPASQPGSVRWQGADFTQPFEFPMTALQAVQFPAAAVTPRLSGEFAVELVTGDMLSGELRGWNDEWIDLQSDRFGPLHLKPQSVRRLYRLTDNPTVLFPSLTGLTGWRTNGKTWREDGPQIQTSDDQAVVTGNFDLPDTAVVEFELSWTDKPSFVLAIGVDPTGDDDKRQDGWRFETWGDTLTVVREQALRADVDRVHALIPSVKRTHLFAYLNQATGSLHVFHSGGTPAASIAVDPEADRQRGRGIRLINRQGGLRLERLRIARWNGVLPFSSEVDQAYCQLADGNAVAGHIIGLSEDRQTFRVRHGNVVRDVPAASLASAEVSFQADDRSGPVAMLLQDGTRLSGEIDFTSADRCVVRSPNVAEPLPVPFDQLRSMMTFQPPDGTSTLAAQPPPGARRGRLEIGSLRLRGWLVPQAETADEHALAWQPEGSTLSSPLRPDASGRIIYVEASRTRPGQTSSPAVTDARAQPGRNFADIFLKKARETPAAVVRPTARAHLLHLRSGDVVPCSVDAIDETGLTITSDVAAATLVRHEDVKAVELVKGAAMPDIAEAKRSRLLTVPRLQKASPPTHLLCARTGDLLRCRLISLSDSTLRVEVQLGEMEVPLERISQIIWFHPEEWTAAADAGSPDAGSSASGAAASPDAASPPRLGVGLVQGVQQDGHRITCDPASFDGTHILGRSDVLGDCRIPVADMMQLVFGREIAADVSTLAFHEWRLQPAVEPLVAQEGGDEPGSAGSLSPLVGQAAPEIDLELLGGGRFKLSESRGQLVVLDFWASWCGPCMQTMPLVEAALREFDPAQVRLVAVNLEERPDQVRPVLERHRLEVAVALDVDGVAGRRYQAQAIPQLVIVDREGKVARLYVGGGPQVVEQLKAALIELLSGDAESDRPARPDA